MLKNVQCCIALTTNKIFFRMLHSLTTQPTVVFLDQRHQQVSGSPGRLVGILLQVPTHPQDAGWVGLEWELRMCELRWCYCCWSWDHALRTNAWDYEDLLVTGFMMKHKFLSESLSSCSFFSLCQQYWECLELPSSPLVVNILHYKFVT
jgi:hypothetical protein